MIDTVLLFKNIQAALANCGRPVGLGDVPAEFETVPYVVIDFLPSGPPEGAWADEHDMRDFVLQVQSVASSVEQCAWMQDAAGRAWLRYGRTVPGYVGLWIDTVGAIVRADDRTYNATDTYRMKVQG